MLEFIENFSKSANFFALFKAIKQFYIDIFVNIFVEKNSNNVYLLQISVVDSNKNKDSFIAYRLNYGRKDLDIVQIFALFKTFNNLTDFIAKNFAINFLFNFVDLFSTKYVTSVRY